MTRTFATLEISSEAYHEIHAKLAASGYGHAFLEDGVIDMQGIGLVRAVAPPPEATMDWKKAEAHLREVREQYAAIGRAGIPGLRIVLDPLTVRLEQGERTAELYDAILATE